MTLSWMGGSKTRVQQARRKKVNPEQAVIKQARKRHFEQAERRASSSASSEWQYAHAQMLQHGSVTMPYRVPLSRTHLAEPFHSARELINRSTPLE